MNFRKKTPPPRPPGFGGRSEGGEISSFTQIIYIVNIAFPLKFLLNLELLLYWPTTYKPNYVMDANQQPDEIEEEKSLNPMLSF